MSSGRVQGRLPAVVSAAEFVMRPAMAAATSAGLVRLRTLQPLEHRVVGVGARRDAGLRLAAPTPGARFLSQVTMGMGLAPLTRVTFATAKALPGSGPARFA